MENEIQIRVQQEVQRFLSNPDNIIAAYQKSLEKKETIIKEMLPKVRMYDVVMGSDKLIEMSAVAKVLNFRGIGRNNLFEYLKERKILRYNNEPYQSYVDAGYFKIVRESFVRDGYEGIYNKTMTTQKGVDYIGKLLTEDGYELNPR